MPRNNKKAKQRALDLESNEDTVISNLAANEDNSTQMDRLKTLQEMFANKIEPDLVRDVFHECAGNAEQTFEKLSEMFDSNQCLSNESPYFPPLDRTIEEVPHLVSEPPINVSTNSNTEYLVNRSTTDPITQVLNQIIDNERPVINRSNHVSALNAVMPFANLFRPKINPPLNVPNNGGVKTSHFKKAKEYRPTDKPDHKDKIREAVHSKLHKVLVLMRGLPGCGKSTLANHLVYGTNGIILSTDDFFLRNGVYRFDANQLPLAHDWNQKRAKKYIESGRTPVVIDNTNLEGWEMKPYVSYGYINNYLIFFLEPDTHWRFDCRELAKRNVHGIPREKIELMAQKYERVAVEDMIRNLNANKSQNQKSLQKSNSDEKMNTNIISTNGLKQIILRSSSSPSAAISSALSVSAKASNSCDRSESPQTSVSAQIEDNPQMDSSSSPVSTEPTSPLPDNQIDIDLLLALNQRNTDSEEYSSVNASDASSQVSQESGWERDDEFTYSHNTPIQETVTAEANDHKPSGSGINGLNKQMFCLNSEPKPQREPKPNVEKVQLEKQRLRDQRINDIRMEDFYDEVSQGSDESNKVYDDSNNSPKSVPKKTKKVILQGVSSATEWYIPEFPYDSNTSLKWNDTETSVLHITRQTQTERKDWALLELKQSNNDSNEGLETERSDGEENLSETYMDPNRVIKSGKPLLHKGTHTADIPAYLTRDQKLDTLRVKFPKAEDNHLNEILDACLEDDEWAEKLLSELDDNHFDVGNLEQLTISSEPSVSSPEIDSESISTNEDEEPFELLAEQKNSEEPDFVLTLDPLLAAQLQSHFGCISDSLTSEDLTISISKGVARLLHHNWKKSLNQKSLNPTQNSSKTQSISIYNNNNKNIKNQKTSKALVLEQNTPKSELQEIMELEMAKALSRQEYDQSLAMNANNACPNKRRMAKELLSTKLKRDQLCQRYPGVDPSFLDTIFESNNYSLGKTIAVLDNSLGLSDDFSKETEALIADESLYSPISGSSRAASPSKPVRKPIDIKVVLSDMNSILEKKKLFHDKARLAFHKKMYAVASYYGDEASQLQRRIERLSEEIVDSILNNCPNSNELDLHGLHIKEVNSILAEYLRRKSEELRKTPGKRKLIIEIITGYGATKGIQGTIKPTVIQYLKQKGFTYELVNMGVIRVTLTQ